jgi:hypothetical protein
MRLEETLVIYIRHILQHIEIDGNVIAVLSAKREEREVDTMDNLTQIKKNRLLQESKDKILETPLFYNDIMKMYAYIYDCTAKSDTLGEIQLMETVKSSLDFLVRGVIK